ncbi:UNVERIFIED_ORG: hypothetical protein J2X79_003736 [Arthrobacter globiformis]|nr:hypothetical protein [Arthrobacter globiformis]
MEVMLTVEASNGTLSHITGSGNTYEEALAAAQAQIPEASRAIVIRTTS